MTTEKQIETNRENALLGGVKTEEGKAISRYNAIKHGLLSNETLLEGEDELQLLDMEKQIRAELKPASEVEFLLIDRVVTNIWRLKRSMRIEKEMIENERKGISFSSSSSKKNIGEVFSDDTKYDTFGKLIRYETSIERGIYRALHELQRIQSARKGERPPVPMAIDIDVSHGE